MWIRRSDQKYSGRLYLGVELDGGGAQAHKAHAQGSRMFHFDQLCSDRAHLGVELDEGGAQAHKAREQGLVQVAVALEGHVLDHGRQLVVVPYQGDSLEPAAPVLGFLHGRASLRAC